MSELSKRMMVTNGNITGIADQLEKDGMIERTQLATDRRSSVIRLTGKGRRYYKKMASAHDAWMEGLFGPLADTTRSELLKHLDELKNLAHAFTLTSPQAS